MENYNEEHDMQAVMGFVAGILIGGLAGAATALLLAPQSGKRTRSQIQHKSLELREQASDKFDDAMDQAQAATQQLSSNVQKQAKKIQHRGQDVIDEQKERWAPLVEAGQKAAKG